MANQGDGARMGSTLLRDSGQLTNPDSARVFEPWLLGNEAAIVGMCHAFLDGNGGSSNVRALTREVRGGGAPDATLTEMFQLLSGHPAFVAQLNGNVTRP